MLFLTTRQDFFLQSPAVTPKIQGPMFLMSSPPGLSIYLYISSKVCKMGDARLEVSITYLRIILF